MKFIMSPSKTLKRTSTLCVPSHPSCHILTNEILYSLQLCSVEQLIQLFSISHKLATKLYDDLHYGEAHPALFYYYGEAFKSLHASDFTYKNIDYLQHHAYIYSALYGLVRPCDAIKPYRLDFLTPIDQLGFEDAHNTIKADVTQQLIESNTDSIVFICSKEFKDMLDVPRLRENSHVIDTRFISIINGKEKIVSVHAKHARGALLRTCALNNVTNTSMLYQIDEFDGWKLDHAHSTTDLRIFKKTYKI